MVGKAGVAPVTSALFFTVPGHHIERCSAPCNAQVEVALSSTRSGTWNSNRVRVWEKRPHTVWVFE